MLSSCSITVSNAQTTGLCNWRAACLLLYPPQKWRDLLSSTHLHDHHFRNCNQVPDSLLIPLTIGTNMAAKVEWTDHESCTAGKYTTLRETFLRVSSLQLLAVYVLSETFCLAETRYCQDSNQRTCSPRDYILAHAEFLPDHFPSHLRKNAVTHITLKIFWFFFLATMSSLKERWLLFQQDLSCSRSKEVEYMIKQFTTEKTWLCTSEIYLILKDIINSRPKMTYIPLQFGILFLF